MHKTDIGLLEKKIEEKKILLEEERSLLLGTGPCSKARLLQNVFLV